MVIPSPINLRSITFNNAPSYYQMDQRLQRAVELAIALNKPLLVGGEPGTGKTQLAYAVAQRLHDQTSQESAPFLEKPLQFNTKSSSSAGDLFYAYDAVSHFRDKSGLPVDHFVDLKALGVAFALSEGLMVGGSLPELVSQRIANAYTEGQRIGKPYSSVVLIDEVDKAPREFPNDLLNEMESLSYEIRELNYRLQKSTKARTVIILTSNFEKNLPAAFLRRCVYYHIPFPETDQLLSIIQNRLSLNEADKPTKLRAAVETFQQLRQQNRAQRAPSTAELLDWLGYLVQTGLYKELPDNFLPKQDDPIYPTYQLITNSLVLKTNQ